MRSKSTGDDSKGPATLILHPKRRRRTLRKSSRYRIRQHRDALKLVSAAYPCSYLYHFWPRCSDGHLHAIYDRPHVCSFGGVSVHCSHLTHCICGDSIKEKSNARAQRRSSVLVVMTIDGCRDFRRRRVLCARSIRHLLVNLKYKYMERDLKDRIM